ncbi:MAG: hypothetical protein J6Y32_06380 [Bacteroidales bacterium]|nr:hypothetical protein [Bacteroidales bacterium]
MKSPLSYKKVVLIEIGRIIIRLVLLTLMFALALFIIAIGSGSLWGLIFLVPIYLLIVNAYLNLMIHEIYERLVRNREKFINENYPHVSFYVNAENIKDCKEFLRIPDTEWASREEKALQYEEEKRRREEQIEKDYLELESIAPHGIEKWLKKNDLKAKWSEENRDDYKRYLSELISSPLSFGSARRPQWVDKGTILYHREEIIELENLYQRCQRDTSWFSNQEHFSQEIVHLIMEKFSYLGRCYYYVPVALADEECIEVVKKATIWQVFLNSYCTEDGLDYTYCPQMKELGDLISGQPYPKDWTPPFNSYYSWSVISEMSRTLSARDVTLIIYEDEALYRLMDNYIDSFFDKGSESATPTPVEGYVVSSMFFSDLPHYKYEDLVSGQCAHNKVLIITALLKTEEIIDIAKQIWERLPEARPNICFISLFKDLSREEMQKLIDKKKKSIAEEEKKKHKEQEASSDKDINPAQELIIQDTPGQETIVVHSAKPSMCEHIVSKPNPKQTDELRILYTPSKAFDSADIYPVVYTPAPNSLVKLPREGRSDIRGYKEPEFLAELKASLTGISISDNFHMRIPGREAPYEPDIVLYDEDINLYIDVEIDEPYDGYNRLVTHIIEGSDSRRDIFFMESGWVVVRFSEKQVHLSSEQCIKLLKNIIAAMRGENPATSPLLEKEPRWNRKQALEWERELYREKYLGIQFFSKQVRTRKITCPDEPEGIDLLIERTPVHVVPVKLEESTLSKQHEKPTEPEPEKAASLELRKPTKLSFDEQSHTYFPSGDLTGNSDRISVTTLIESFFPNFDEEAYIKKRMEETGMTEDEVRRELAEPSERGTDMHKQIENYLKGLPYDGSSKEFQFFLRFHEEQIVRRGLKFDSAEYPIELKDSNIAGTVDALFRKPNGDYVMVDWKRSKHLIIDGYPKKYGFGSGLSVLKHLDNSSYYKYELQQSFYRYILEKDYGIKVSSMILAVLYPEYERYYTVKLSQYRKQEVLDMIESYESTL